MLQRVQSLLQQLVEEQKEAQKMRSSHHAHHKADHSAAAGGLALLAHEDDYVADDHTNVPHKCKLRRAAKLLRKAACCSATARVGYCKF